MEPPQDMLRDALDKVFRHQSIPLAGLVLRCYIWFHNHPHNTTETKILNVGNTPAFVAKYIMDRHNFEAEQAQEAMQAGTIAATSVELQNIIACIDSERLEAAHAAANAPTQSMINVKNSEDKGRLFQT
ncbi:hypothetical protein CVT25_000824 [Psilocybe cyanescens]|uniref:Uncharacterized protein n=1 Tax=Psilocybe cyanescens TaxID=93625 RepID=A0A409XSE8_PSICY|nr:hypothetical protein CVT25_000824 [Psilocybe cyanescens]